MSVLYVRFGDAARLYGSGFPLANIIRDLHDQERERATGYFIRAIFLYALGDELWRGFLSDAIVSAARCA